MKEQRIPTLLGIFLLLVGLGSLLFIIQNRTALFSFASQSAQPKGIMITNLSDTSATVNWYTDEPTVGYITLSTGGLFAPAQSMFDIRDTDGSPQKRLVHSVKLIDLSPGKKYAFTLVSDRKQYRNSQFAVTTAPTLADPLQRVDPAFGTLVSNTNEPIDEALVYASFEGSQTISSVVQNGSWTIPLGTLRSKDNSRYFIPGKDDAEQLRFIHPTAFSEVTTTIDNDSPLPPVRLGESYDFKMRSSRGPIIAQAASNTTVTAQVGTTAFQITSPAKDAAIPNSHPAFKGSGVVGKIVILTISGNKVTPISEQVVVDSDGRWSWSVGPALSAGTYSISAASFDKSDKPMVVSQGFSILKSGSQVLQAATPAASLTPSPSPILASPTPEATQSIPVTGAVENTIFLLFGALTLLLFGVVGFSFEKKANVNKDTDGPVSF